MWDGSVMRQSKVTISEDRLKPVHIPLAPTVWVPTLVGLQLPSFHLSLTHKKIIAGSHTGGMAIVAGHDTCQLEART